MEGRPLPQIQFAGVQIDVRRACVYRHGTELRLRPKTFEVLLYLIENRDRVVSKAELFDHVWGGSAVTEDTLVQSVVEIRKALGDDSRASEFVRTIARVGYRFVAPLDPPSVEVAAEPIVEDLRPNVRWSRRAIAAAAVIVAILGVLGAVWASRQRESVGGSARMTVAVALFEARKCPPDLGWLRDGLPAMVTSSLSREPQLSIIDRGTVERLAGGKASTSADWLEVGRRARAQRLITGRFEANGDQIRVDVWLYDVNARRMIGGSSVVSTRESLLRDVASLTSTLSTLLVAKPSVAVARTSDRMTDNLNAYEAYCRGVAAADGMRNEEAVEQFDRALALDPQFAMAHARIGYAYAVTGHSPDLAKPHLAKALALGDHLSERERLYVLAWQSIADRDYARATDYFRLIVSRYPMDIEAYARLGRLLIGDEQLNEAITVAQRGLAADPDAAELHNVIGIAYSYQGRHAEAIAHHQRYVAALPAQPNAHDSLGLSYQWAGEYDHALQAYDEALRLNPRFELAIVHRANTFWQLGRNRDAIRELRRFIATAASESDRWRGYGELMVAQCNLGHIDPEVVRHAVQDDPDGQIFRVLDAVFHRRAAEASRLIESIHGPSTVGRGARASVRLWAYLRAETARIMGDETHAIEYAREVLRHVPPTYMLDDLEDALGDTLAAFGHHLQAVEEYRRILRLNANRGRARFKLARELEAAGQAGEARSEYQRFLLVWKDADRDAPEIIGATQRLAALSRQRHD